MYLATVDHPRRRLTEFVAGCLLVSMCGGLLIMLGPGRLLLAVVPKPKPPAKHVIELVAGMLLLAIAILLWSGRRALGRRKPPTFSGSRRSGVMLGAAIASTSAIRPAGPSLALA